MVESLSRNDWEAAKRRHEARVGPLARDRLARTGRKHPVYDFLFEYYSYRAGHLLRWSPGIDVHLRGATPADLAWPQLFAYDEHGAILLASAFPAHRIEQLDWAIAYQTAIRDREPQFACFGLHEWAMVYRAEEIRHSRVPLRLTAGETDNVVSAAGVRCTHFDAYRFFTPSALQLNKLELSRANSPEHDQPGCVHANMDLYKFAFKFSPFTSSAVLGDAFELAVAARELDMRASPYDLSGFGFAPIAVETRSGREEYVEGQREIHRRAGPVREKLLRELGRLWRAARVHGRASSAVAPDP